MMRYRLRTLMIVVTAACVYLAWVGYCRRMARFYREQSSEFLLKMVEQGSYFRTVDSAEITVSDLIQYWPEQAAKMSDPKFIEDDAQNALYASAVVQEITARKYDRAAWNPWVLISN